MIHILSLTSPRLGKVLPDEKTVEACEIREKDFLVLMVSKVIQSTRSGSELYLKQFRSQKSLQLLPQVLSHLRSHPNRSNRPSLFNLLSQLPPNPLLSPPSRRRNRRVNLRQQGVLVAVSCPAPLSQPRSTTLLIWVSLARRFRGLCEPVSTTQIAPWNIS